MHGIKTLDTVRHLYEELAAHKAVLKAAASERKLTLGIQFGSNRPLLIDTPEVIDAALEQVKEDAEFLEKELRELGFDPDKADQNADEADIVAPKVPQRKSLSIKAKTPVMTAVFFGDLVRLGDGSVISGHAVTREGNGHYRVGGFDIRPGELAVIDARNDITIHDQATFTAEFDVVGA